LVTLVLPLLAVLGGEPDAFATHQLGLEIPLGLGMPTGLLGAALDWTPRPWFSLEAGGGYDRSFGLLGDGAEGVQWSLMPRLRLFKKGFGLSLGVGVSGGRYQWCDSCPWENGDRWDWSQAIWVNVEGAVEYRWQSGMGLRLVFGGADLTNPDDVTCSESKYGCGDIAPARRQVMPYFGFLVRIPLTER
jgi:hypothetical protein